VINYNGDVYKSLTVGLFVVYMRDA